MNKPLLTCIVPALPILCAALLLGGCRDMTGEDQPPRELDRTQETRDSASAAAASTDEWQVFGEPDALPVAADLPAVSVSEVAADPDVYTGRPLRLEGTITDVCQTRGCWLKMADTADQADDAVFVKFTCPVDGFLIPTDSIGKPVVVTGEVVVEEMSEADARHIAAESGRPAAEVEAINGPQQVIRVLSPTAKVRV